LQRLAVLQLQRRHCCCGPAATAAAALALQDATVQDDDGLQPLTILARHTDLLLMLLMHYHTMENSGYGNVATALALQDSTVQDDDCLQRLAILPPHFVCAVISQELRKAVELLRSDIRLERRHLHREDRQVAGGL
jgi:CBS-domain-containing membrane protein